jgi:hypothetical protein
VHKHALQIFWSAQLCTPKTSSFACSGVHSKNFWSALPHTPFFGVHGGNLWSAKRLTLYKISHIEHFSIIITKEVHLAQNDSSNLWTQNQPYRLSIIIFSLPNEVHLAVSEGQP